MKLRRLLIGTTVSLGAALLLGLTALYLLYGTGEFYPDTTTEPLRPTSQLEQVLALDFPPGNVTVAPNGRVFFNLHPFAQAQRFDLPTVFELVDGKAVPYPDAAFQKRYQGTFGLKADAQNRLWMIEPRGLDHARTRLLAFDLNTNRLVFEHWFSPTEAQFTQDLRISPDGKTVYLADTGLFQLTPASLLILDVASKTHRVVFQHLPAAQPQRWITRRFDGKPHTLGFGLISFTVGLDGIELSPDGQWLYFATMSHEGVFRVPTAALLETTLTEAALAATVEKVGPKPLSDGITFDTQGNLLLTDIEHGALAQLSRDGQLKTLVRSPDIIWSDGVALAPDGAIWLTDSGIPAYIDPLARPPRLETLKAAGPYGLWRLPALAPDASLPPPEPHSAPSTQP